jgi:hypothetical protein
MKSRFPSREGNVSRVTLEVCPEGLGDSLGIEPGVPGRNPIPPKKRRPGQIRVPTTRKEVLQKE